MASSPLTTTGFLKALFPLDGPDDPRADEFVRIAAIDRTEVNGLPRQVWPGTLHWLTRAQIAELKDGGVSELPFRTKGLDVYVTPHPWATKEHGDRSKKEHAAPYADCCWCELDDGDIDPANFLPEPTIVVRTSGDPAKGTAHHHLYWRLDKAYPAEAVEQLNRRIVYGNGVRADKGGWDLTQWLRLPGSYSYKRDQANPNPIEVVAYHPERVYSADSFVDLPPPPAAAQAVDAPLPGADKLPEADAVRERYKRAITPQLLDLLDRRHEDRSKALWRVYQICASLQMTPEECFVLARGSANDKFSDYRYNGEEALWRDVRKGFHAAERPEDAPIVSVIRGILSGKGPKEEKRYEVARAVHRDLIARGRLYHDPERRAAYYYDGERVTPIEATGHDWRLLLNKRYRLNPADDGFLSIHNHLYLFATEGDRVTPRTLCWWDRKQRVLYVYRGDGRVYRLDGVAEATVVENGTDGVLFLDRHVARFQAKPAEGAPSLDEAVFGLPNYVDNAAFPHSRADATLIAKLWFYSLFFAEHMDARPHLVACGETDSGKTSLMQAMAELVEGEGTKVDSVPGDRREFEAVVSNARHVFFDNVDEMQGRRWFVDALAELATGIQFTRRVLYTTNETVTYRVQCHVGISCRDQWFARTDVATRLVVLHTERREKKVNPTTLFDQIRRWRDALWAEVVRDLTRIVAWFRVYDGGEEQELRMAGFADFVLVAAAALDQDGRRLIGLIQAGQKDTALSNSVVWQCLNEWLRLEDASTGQRKNNATLVSVMSLHKGLKAVAERMGCERDYLDAVPSPRSLGQQVKELLPDIQTRCHVEVKKRSPANLYRFTLKAEELVEQLPTGAQEAA